MTTQRIFVTGCAGFIGFHYAKRLLDEGFEVVGFDSINDYYDTKLKKDRLDLLKGHDAFHFEKGSLEELEQLESIFNRYNFDIVVHLAAQAGVRYSLENPHAYIQANMVGFTNILECSRKHQIDHLLYASSSSVYGANKKIPFSVEDRVDHPVSLYAATKKSNELLAYTYSHLYQLPTTGLRFFTVYGPWGRPDMALFSFTDKIVHNKPIQLYNHGNMKRDFTYIDDVVESIYRLMKNAPPQHHKVFNIGNHQPVKLDYFVELIEKNLGMKATKELLPMQPGEVEETYADIDDLIKAINYKPTTSIEDGIEKFVEWYKGYYDIKGR